MEGAEGGCGAACMQAFDKSVQRIMMKLHQLPDLVVGKLSQMLDKREQQAAKVGSQTQFDARIMACASEKVHYCSDTAPICTPLIC